MTDEQPTTVPTVFEAWREVMAEVTVIAKSQQMSGGGVKYNFRGIDQMTNVLSPVLRRHKVMIVPTVRDIGYETEVLTSNDRQRVQTSARLVMEYTVYGPAGDCFVGSMAGEGSDSSDKSTSKAESMALKYFLSQSLMLATDEPDPEATHDDRTATATATEANEQARKLGWGNAEELGAVWERRMATMRTMSAEDQATVVEWGRALEPKLAPSTLTPDRAEEWGTQMAQLIHANDPPSGPPAAPGPDEKF